MFPCSVVHIPSNLGLIIDDCLPTFLFRNLSAFAQDTWRIVPRLTLTYGLRWDVDFVPQSLSGPGFPAAVGFDLNNFSSLGVAPAGTAPYATHYANFAPRVGVAYGLSQRQDWQTVLRGGVGVFYDLASSEAGNNVAIGLYPFGGESLSFSGTFPLTNPNAPAISFPTASNPQGVYLFDPHLKLPYTMQWNAALEQGLGRQQSLSVSYVGAAGRRQLQTTSLFLPPSPTIAFTELVTNAGTSDYDALQVQFQRRLSHGVQALTSYTWSHSIDTGSAGSIGVVSNAGLPSVSGSNRGPSDFDIRHTFSAGVTYDIPALKINALTNAVLGGWSLENIVQVRSAPPVDITYLPAFFSFANGIYGDVRPDLVPGQPLYLYGAECASIFQATQDLAPRESCPGGRGFNPSAFTAPATYPTGQGTTPRNFLRGFSAAQWDFAIHRQFKLSDSLKLQFRAEMFNLLNHPNLGPLSGQFGNGQGFGLSTAMLGRSFSDNLGGAGSGGFSSLYQIGGPRSVQLALKLAF